MDFGDGSIYVAMMAVLGALLAGIMGNTSGLSASLGLVPTLIISPVIAVVARSDSTEWENIVDVPSKRRPGG